jgi:exodeoxyribonuclease V alpha subunit
LNVTPKPSTNRPKTWTHPCARTIPASYARGQVELSYATTVYGAQGETVDQAHLVLGDHTSAASAYVAMTRGRHHNTAHVVADTHDQARPQWIEVFTRDRADLGPAHAAVRAGDDIERYGSMARIQAMALRARPAPEPQPQPANLSEHHETGPSIGP